MTSELIATCWTSAGDTSPLDEDVRSPESFQHRVEAVAGAGYVGLGFVLPDLEAAEQRFGIDTMRAILRDNGIRRLEVEFLSGWWNDEDADPVAAADLNRMLYFVEQLGGTTLKIAPEETGAEWHLERWAERFRSVASKAADLGARTAIEFLPWANIATAGDALRLIQAADHPGAGMVLDVWHIEHMATPHSEIAQLPASSIVSVELSDANARVGSWQEDTVKNRRYPGEGRFALPSLVAAIREAGFNAPWGVEILSTEHRAQPIEAALARAASTARALLDGGVRQQP